MMNRMKIEDALDRFKRWQEKPYEYRLISEETHHCNNCGNDYTGNFCPICSQKAGSGRIGWQSVRQGIMDIWGLGTRSLLYSIWQLLWRPGHIISDYIDGKRQVSFPPVKMLFIVAVLFSMVYYWFIPDILGFSIEQTMSEDEKLIFKDTVEWLEANYSWYALIMALLAVIPTWLMFRYSPRHTGHSLPEGFFIQVFLAVLMVVFSFLLMPLAFKDETTYSIINYLVFGVYYIIVYKYIFGYNVWGTLWRSGFILLTISFLMACGLFLASNMDMNMVNRRAGVDFTQDEIFQDKMAFALLTFMLAMMVLSVGFVINYIATRKERQQMKLNSNQNTRFLK